MAPATRARPRPTIKIPRRSTNPTVNNAPSARDTTPPQTNRISKSPKPDSESKLKRKLQAAVQETHRVCDIIKAELDKKDATPSTTTQMSKAERKQKLWEDLAEAEDRCDALHAALEKMGAAPARPKCLICWEPFSEIKSSPRKSYSCPNEACVATFCVGCIDEHQKNDSKCPHCRCELKDAEVEHGFRYVWGIEGLLELEPRTPAMVVNVPTQRRHRFGA